VVWTDFCLVSTQFTICNRSVSNILRTSEKLSWLVANSVHTADTDKTLVGVGDVNWTLNWPLRLSVSLVKRLTCKLHVWCGHVFSSYIKVIDWRSRSQIQNTQVSRWSVRHSVLMITSNVTSRHRGPKRKRSWRHLASVITTLYYVAVGQSHILSTLFFIVDCDIARFLCVMRVFNVRASSSSPVLPSCQISFLSRTPLLS